MASTAEQRVSRALRAVLADLPDNTFIADSEQFREVLSGLEYFLSKLLGEIHSEWRDESLDGVLPLVARKTGEGEIEILGHCIIISDQSVTPLRLCLQIAPSADEVSWLTCSLGEKGEHGMVRTPYQAANAMSCKLLYPVEGKPEPNTWAYNVTFGHRRG